MRALVGLIAVTVGCFKGPATPTTEPPVPAKPAPRARATTDALAFLPADAQIVGVLDFKELRGSQLWKRFEPILQQRLGTYRPEIKDCQIDPLSSIRRMSFGLSDVQGSTRGVVVVRGFRRDIVMPCLELARAGSQRKLTITNGVVEAHESNRHVMATFADDTTLVIQFGPQVDANAFAAALDGGAPLRMAPVLGELLGRLDPAHPMWLAVVDGSIFKGQTAGMNAKSLVASARIGDAVAAQLRLRVDDPANAAALATQFQAQLGSLSMMADELTAVAEDADLVMTVKMSSAQLDAMLSLIGPSLGIP